MRIIVFLIILGLMPAYADVYSQKGSLSVRVENLPMRDALRKIEKISGMRFFMSDDLDAMNETVNINVKDQSFEQIMTSVLGKSGLSYKIYENNLVIITESKSILQGIQVTGAVTDAEGEPMPGVNVVVKGTTTGVITDIDGKYKIHVPNSDAVLVFSFVGYSTHEFPVGNQTTINIALDEDTREIEEIVVVGYGTQKKGEVTSSVVKISEKDFNKGPSTNPMQLIEGRVAGLTVNRPSGSDPNGEVNVQMRGVSSLKGNNQPLVIIDGIPANMTSLNTIAPEDIEAMDILRDGSAAAIYGTRGNNGVVIVTTKRAKTGGYAQLDYSGYISHDFIAKKPDILTADEYLEYAKVTQNPNIKDYGGRDKVYDALLNTNNFGQSHNLSATGGNEKTNYRASLGYRDVSGIGLTTERQTITARIAANHKAMNDKLLLNFNLANSYIDAVTYLGTDGKYDYDAFYQATKKNPTYPIYNDDGTFYEDYATYGEQNPVAALKQRDRKSEMKNLLASIKATYTIIDGLNASAFVAYERNDNQVDDYRSNKSYDAIVNANGGTAYKKYEQWTNRTFEGVFDYKKTFMAKHNLTAMAGYSYQDFVWESFDETNKGFLTDAFLTNNMTAGSFLKEGRAEMTSDKNKSQLIAFFGRINYNFASKYMFSASIRREGSSKFGKDHKWGWFPAISGGWMISEESFMSDIRGIDMLKLRVGYGITGSLPTDPYMSLIKYGTGAGFFYDGKWYTASYGPGNNPNPDLRWEKNQSLNFGLDFGFLNNRLTGSLDIYQKRTVDLLGEYQAQVPAMIHSTINANVGKLRNRGVELSISGLVVNRSNFTYNANVTFSYETNKLVSMSNDIYKGTYEDRYSFPSPGNIGYAQRLEEGQPVGSFYGYVYEGISNDGKWILKDLDGISGLSDADKQYIGTGIPKIKAGLMNTFAYKGWDFSFFIRGMFDYKILNEGRVYFGTTTNIDKSAYNVYKSALDVKLTEDPVFSDYFLENGNFVKIDNVTLGYTFTFPDNKYIRSLRLYGYINNLAVITGYDGLDPEVKITGLEPGIESRASYPRTRTISFGVNVSF